jgi:hypothetical protein
MARDDFFEAEQSEPMEIHATISVEQNFPGLPPFHLKQKNVNLTFDPEGMQKRMFDRNDVDEKTC